MKPQRLIGLLVCCIPLLDSCAMQQSAQAPDWKIAPLTRVSHAASAADYYQLGRYEQEQRRYERAAVAYRKALGMDPSSVDALDGLGVVSALQGQYDQAVDLLSRAVKLAPASATVQNNLGYALCLQGNARQAVVALREAARLDPDNHRTLVNLAWAYERAGDHANALMARTEAMQTPATVHFASGKIDRLQPPVAITAAYTAPAALSGHPLAMPEVPVEKSSPSLPFLVSPAQAGGHESQGSSPVSLQAGHQAGEAAARIEVANGNGVNGMARQVGVYLRAKGLDVGRLTNRKPFTVRMTQIQYRHGYVGQARQLQALLPHPARLVPSPELHDRIQVRLVLGRNVSADRHWFAKQSRKTRLTADQTGRAVLRVATAEAATR